MATAGRLTATTTLQNAQAGAANGTTMNISTAEEVVVEVSGTYTGITCNFEGSIDGGATWFPVALLSIGVVPVVNVLLATAVGFYRLDHARGINAFRARTTVSAPTGSMTVKAVAGVW